MMPKNNALVGKPFKCCVKGFIFVFFQKSDKALFKFLMKKIIAGVVFWNRT